MGTEQSRSPPSSRNNKKYSQDEVDRIIRIEKLKIEQNYKNEMARTAARQKVEELLLQSKNQPATSSPSPLPETSTAVRQKAEELLLRRNNRPATASPSPLPETSFTQNELHVLVANPTVTNPNPNAGNVRSPPERSNVTPNATNKNRTSPQTPVNVNTVIIDNEAQSFTQNELHVLVANPTVTNPNPIAGNVRSPPERSNVTPNATNKNRTSLQTRGNVNTAIIDNEAQSTAVRQKAEELLLRRNNRPATASPSPLPETSFTQNELHVLVANPTVTNPNPNAGNVRSPPERSNVTPNATNKNRTSPQTPVNVNTVIIDNEAQSFTQNELHVLVANPTVTNPNPIAGNVRSPPERSNVTPNATNKNRTSLQTRGNVNTAIIDNEAQSTAVRQKAEELLLRRNNRPATASPSPLPETSFTQNELHVLVANPTVTNPNPNAGNVRSPPERSNVTPNATNKNSTSLQTRGNVNTAIIDNEAQRVPKKNERPETSRVNADEDDELNCYTCKRKYNLNIYQCPRGHSSCHLCRASLARCGVCGSPIGDMRNNALEAYIAQRQIRCPNSQDGCRLLIKMANLEAHTRQCLFRELACPLSDLFGLCRWRGKLQQISKHFDDTHPFHRTGNVNTEMAVSLNDSQIVHLVVVGSFHFLFHMKVCEQRRAVYMVVQLIGTKHSAAKWSYEIYVYNKSDPRRQYHYTDVCQSINTPLTQIIADENCATLPFDYTGTFMNNNRINYKFYIKRDVESGSARYPVYGGARNRSWVRQNTE